MNWKRWIWFLIILFPACATTSQELKQDYGDTIIRFEVNRGYQEVYRIILNKTREKYLGGPYVRVDGDLFTDIQEGNIVADQGGYLGTFIFMAIDIKALSKEKTEVTAYSIWRRQAKEVEEWINH